MSSGQRSLQVVGKPISWVVFDCDGVLCPPLRFADALERRHGITVPMTSSFFRDALTPALLGREDAATLLPPFLETWSWNRSLKEFLELWIDTEHELDRSVLQLIAELRRRGVKTALATNQEPRRTRDLRDRSGIERHFDRIFISCEMGLMKPDPLYFEAIERELGVDPGTILFVDDSIRFLDAASERGWRTTLFTDTEDLELAFGIRDRRRSSIETSSRAVVLEDGQVLVSRVESNPSIVFLPGGRIEPGEHLAAALNRELAEELDARGRVVAYLGRIRSTWTAKETLHEVEHRYFRVRSPSLRPGAPVSSREPGTDFAWEPLHSLRSLPLKPPSLAGLLERLDAGHPFLWNASDAEA